MQNLQQPVVTELLPPLVLGFVQAVGIDKEWSPFDAVQFLALVIQSRPGSYRRIGQHVEEIAVVFTAAEDRSIMSCIAEVEMTRLQVENLPWPDAWPPVDG